MTQDDGRQQALSYIQHQAEKGLESLAALIERTAADWQLCLEATTDAQAAFAPGDEWSAKEVLGHVLRGSRGVNRQIAEAVAGRIAERPFGDAEALRDQPAVDEQRPIEELRRDVAALFGETRAFIASLKDDGRLARAFEHPFFGDLNLKEWIAFQRIHSMDHIQQIEKLKAHPAYPAA